MNRGGTAADLGFARITTGTALRMAWKGVREGVRGLAESTGPSSIQETRVPCTLQPSCLQAVPFPRGCNLHSHSLGYSPPSSPGLAPLAWISLLDIFKAHSAFVPQSKATNKSGRKNQTRSWEIHPGPSCAADQLGQITSLPCACLSTPAVGGRVLCPTISKNSYIEVLTTSTSLHDLIWR